MSLKTLVRSGSGSGIQKKNRIRIWDKSFRIRNPAFLNENCIGRCIYSRVADPDPVGSGMFSTDPVGSGSDQYNRRR